MRKQTLAAHHSWEKKLYGAASPILALESGAMHELTRSKKRLNAATLHVLQLVRRA
jgi:hypothetical protein